MRLNSVGKWKVIVFTAVKRRWGRGVTRHFEGIPLRTQLLAPDSTSFILYSTSSWERAKLSRSSSTHQLSHYSTLTGSK